MPITIQDKSMRDSTYLPDTRRSSTASSTLCLKVSSLASSNSNCAGESSNSMPVILLARDCKGQSHMKNSKGQEVHFLWFNFLFGSLFVRCDVKIR